MFDSWKQAFEERKERRALKRKLYLLKKQEPSFNTYASEPPDKYDDLYKQIQECRLELDVLITSLLLRKAGRLGIEIPRKEG